MDDTLSDPAGAVILFEAYGPNFGLLLARHIYDIFSDFWPNAGDFSMANVINAATKYIITHRPDSMERGPIKSLGKDVIEAILALKSTDGPDLIVVGSSMGLLINTDKHLGSLKKNN